MPPKLLYQAIFLLLPYFLGAQSFNYVHYDTRDGIAGSTIYDMCQDNDGFMWFATDNGLSRYDGTHFKNFTDKDGLPDNEVLKLFVDKKGRVWIGSFTKKMCYYLNGKIYNETNDSLVRKIHFESNLGFTVQTSKGVIAFCDQDKLIIITPGNELLEFSNTEIFGTTNKMVMWLKDDKIFIASGNSAYTYYNGGRSFVANTDFKGPGTDSAIIKMRFKQLFGEIPKDRITMQLMQDRISVETSPSTNYTLFVNTNNGSWMSDTVNSSWKYHFLAGKKISRTVVDREQNIWFSTQGEGLYKLPSTEIRSVINPFNDQVANNEIFSVETSNHSIFAGIGFSKMITNESNIVSGRDFSDIAKLSKNFLKNNRLYTMTRLSSGIIMLGFDGFLLKLDGNKQQVDYSFAIKSVAEINKDEILVGTSGCAFTMRVSDLKVLDTIWRERSTKVFFYNDKYYVGTLNGLYEIDRNKKAVFLGSLQHALSRRITDIKQSADDGLWVATSDEGIVSYKDGKVNHVLNDSDGLSSNICRSLFLDNRYLWVGTNKGINKVDLSQPGLAVRHYSTSDLLPSDLINAICVVDSIVWVGSPAGLVYFNENRISNTSVCILKMLSVNISGKDTAVADNYNLSYNQKNIRFDFVAISFKSGGEMTYWYRLNGFNNQWQQTTQTSLDYQSLPSGSYELEMYAINKFGLRSNVVGLHFTISRPFWKAWWFRSLCVLGLMGIILYIVGRRNRKIRSSLEEKNRVQQQFAALEQRALQAQMNPHFIFNCLNSIQQYILTNDKEKANEYLTGFASLVRQTLDNSGKKTITIAEEARYLGQYLEMEKMRFGDNFTYEIKVDRSVRADFVEMPALLLQPYVENSIRHGIRYKTDHSGHVEILFSMRNEVLYCLIRDNGIGRRKAAEYKSMQHIEYQSKEISLTEKRIELLNKVNETDMQVKITDLTNTIGHATGTEVIIEIPL